LTISPPLICEDCVIDENCIGERWLPRDEEQLASLVAIIAMGQATQAAHILNELQPAHPAFVFDELKHEATVTLTVQNKKQRPRLGYPRWQRDGFIFEAISWIAARQEYGQFAYMKDPHVSATTQGLDGLMIELSEDLLQINRTTIFEDKCTDYPRKTFLGKVIPGFIDRHKNLRSAEIIGAASALLRMAGIQDDDSAKLSAAVTDRKTRRYRAAFSLPSEFDKIEARSTLFADYDRIGDISAEQRIGASFLVPIAMRDWMDRLALKAILYINNLQDEGS